MTARQLTKSHTVENLAETTRIRSAHPSGESGNILRNGRLLGELIPLRAFGDARYKWPMDLQRVVLGPFGYNAPTFLHTPPYLTPEPEVFYHQLTTNDRFLILATDGLWEFVDPDTAIRIVYDHSLGANTMSTYNPIKSNTLEEVVRDLESRQMGDSKKPLDENSATHLIRNALGGCSGGVDLQYSRLEEILQVPPGMARQLRDDITVMIVYFSDEYLERFSQNV